jgi:hypothetical protein
MDYRRRGNFPVAAAARLAYRLTRGGIQRLVDEYGPEIAVALGAVARRYVKKIVPLNNKLVSTADERQSVIDRHKKLRDRFREKGDESRELKHKTRAPKESASLAVKKRVVMKRNSSYRGNFRRPRRRPTKFRLPCVVKDERRIVKGPTAECAYVLHCTHPAKYVMRMIGMAFVYEYFRQADFRISNWLDRVATTTGNAIPATFTNLPIQLRCWYQKGTSSADPTEPTGATLFNNNQSYTFLDMADEIANGLTNIIGANPQVYFIQFLWTGGDVASPSAIAGTAAKRWMADEMYIAVSGKSIVNIQNRTEGGNPDADDKAQNTLTTSIYANPLIGKHYAGSGPGPRLRDISYTTQNQAYQFIGSSLSGLASFTASDTTLSPTLKDVMKQPPNGTYFKNCYSQTTIRIEPGAIKKSTVYKKVSHSLNNWVKHLQTSLDGAATVVNISTQPVHMPGAYRIIALEKVANIANNGQIVIGLEKDAVYMSGLRFRKRRSVPATNSQIEPNQN